jgi:hypothetical protein
LYLIVALDEAGSEIYSPLLIEEESAASRFRAGRSNEGVVVLLLHRSEWLDIEPPFLL